MDDTLNQPAVDRGPWPTSLAAVVALLPLVVATAAAILADRRQVLGPVGPNDLVYWVVIPLGALYPTVAAVARRMAYAPMTVLVIASVVPAFVYASRLLMEPLARDASGRLAISPTLVANIALPPALLAAGAFVSIELSSAAMRRGVAVGVFGAIAAALVFAAAVAAPLVVGPVSFG
jgi:hypothetical protein